MSMELAMNRVARGMTYLAERGRQPLVEINADKFNIKNPCFCALGQTLPGADGMSPYVALWSELYDGFEETDALPEGAETATEAADQWMRERGFLWGDDVTAPELQRAWLTVICAAQDIPVPSPIWPVLRIGPVINMS
jgi:hypothetical protein